jgi:superfamily I DNA/RNA helicase
MQQFNAQAIFGPPGTGKTTEMLRLVGDAKVRGYGAHEIGFFSFTKAAAGEALKRLGLQRSDKISTLHSLAFRSMGASPMSMVDSYKLRKFGRVAGIEFAGVSNEEYGDQMGVGDKYLAIYNLARSTLGDKRAAYYDDDERPGDYAQFLHCIDSYESWKKAYGFIDFTDLIEQYVQRPGNHGARVLFIDEAQDLSRLQWAMIDRMVKFDQVDEVTIAGDDDQAIYEWSGADPHGMAAFVTAYDARADTLAQSYRVPRAVHELAREVAASIQNRVKKRYRPAPREGLVERYGSGFVPESIEHGDDVLILARSHTQKKEIEEAMVAIRKPYRVEGGKPGLFDSIWAEGLRAFRKLEQGGSLGAAELEAIAKVGTNDTKADLNKRDFGAVIARGETRSIAIPSHLVEFFREADLSETPTIRLSTIHASKGREARRVVLHTGITSRTEQAIDKNPDAEARVWYVGVTRAIEQLDVVSGADRSYNL